MSSIWKGKQIGQHNEFVTFKDCKVFFLENEEDRDPGLSHVDGWINCWILEKVG